MEGSEKGRDRLRVISMEAASQLSSPSTSSSFCTNSPPPAVAVAAAAAAAAAGAGEATLSAPRFDFYTDPISAFTCSVRKGGGGDRGGSYNPQESFSSPIRSPSPMSLPSPHHLLGRVGCMFQVFVFLDYSAGSKNYYMVSPSHQHYVNQSPDLSPYSPGSGSLRSQGPYTSPFSVTGAPVVNVGGWERSTGSSGHGFSPNSSRGGLVSPGFGRGGSPLNSSGRSSTLYVPWRGKNWQSGGSPSRGRTGWRGRGFYDHGSTHQATGNIFCKDMLQDPWHELKPIVGNILVARGGPESWLAKSLIAKKPKSEEGGREFSSQSSLGESLALAFEEAVSKRDA